MKPFLWLFTVIGLLPVAGFAMLHLASWVALRRELAREPANDDGSFTLITTSYVSFGESSSPMNVSTHAWPAILILIGALCCVIGLIYLIPRQPLRVSRDGYSRLEPLIKKVVSSSRDHPSLIVSARNGNEALLVMRGESGFELSVSADTNDDKLVALKTMFAKRGVHPANEYTTHDDHFGTDTTHLAFPLVGDSNEIADVCIQVFRDIFGVSDDEPMEFTIEH
jgi:hypothetical protein